MEKTYILCGIRIHRFANTSGHSREESLEHFSDKKHELILANYQGENPEYWSLMGWTTHGMCGSGYTTASWGHIETKRLDMPGPMHYVSKKLLTLEWDFDRETSQTRNDIFAFLEEGCQYYPHGKFEFEKDLQKDFHNTGRLPDKPMLHVFYGASALGKSTLSSLTGKKCYETDAAYDIEEFFDDLPDNLEDCILVLGNKHNNLLEPSKKEQIKSIRDKYNEAYKLVFVEFKE